MFRLKSLARAIPLMPRISEPSEYISRLKRISSLGFTSPSLFKDTPKLDKEVNEIINDVISADLTFERKVTKFRKEQKEIKNFANVLTNISYGGLAASIWFPYLAPISIPFVFLTHNANDMFEAKNNIINLNPIKDENHLIAYKLGDKYIISEKNPLLLLELYEYLRHGSLII